MDNNLETMRHSCSHLLAAAVVALWPDTKLAIGPAIETGFYYDFDPSPPAGGSGQAFQITEADLPKIEAKMAEIKKENLPFIREEVSLGQAKKLFKDQPYKLELINDLAKEGMEKVCTYRLGDFLDLCLGPHVENTSEIGSFKLLSVAGAYWKGSEKNKMLTRIYGTCFPTEKELEEYLHLLEEAKKRDHKKLGPELGLFMFHETAPGMPYWLPNGVTILNELINFWRVEHQKRGYQEIKSPLINKKELYETSGHWEHYRDHMFLCQTEENEIYGLKPMNCPNAMVVFDSKVRSYRDLPLRLSDTDTLHRSELSGTLNGLLRVREFTQDDAHIFVREVQIEEEYQRILEIVYDFYVIFDLPYSFRLGTRPDKFMGDPALWDKAEKELEKILKKSGQSFVINKGDGAFYGPKIDILVKDALGREWQTGTIQLDFQLPRRFNLKYINEEGKEETPVVIHRVIYGSLERFIAILIEHYAGAFPVWLAPVQVKVVPVSDKSLKYGREVAKKLRQEEIRAELDERDERMQAKIRDAEKEKIPYMLIVGPKEAEEGTVSVRVRGEKDLGPMKFEEFLAKIKEDIAKKRQI